MKLIETNVSAKSVHMRIADDGDLTKAKSWIDFRLPLDSLTLPSETKIGDPELQLLGVIQIAALRYARGVVADEAQRLAKLIDHSR
jgi:hypothetical protein